MAHARLTPSSPVAVTLAAIGLRSRKVSGLRLFFLVLLAIPISAACGRLDSEERGYLESHAWRQVFRSAPRENSRT